ncbi:10158_t:CDS:2, partial [Scutellospora calospora]
DVRAEAYALVLSAKNTNAGSSYLTHLYEFILESVKERLDMYNIKTLPDYQALADVIVMLCIHLAELKTLYITDTGHAISSGRIGDPKAVYSTVAYEAKNIAHTYTIAGECLRHSSNNHTSPMQNYI